MTFEIFNFSVKPESTKDMIIMILSEEFPLTLPKIKNILQKKYQKTISYQGIYKELNLMIEKKIIIKEDKSYLLNKEWILNLNKYSKELYAKYNNSLTEISYNKLLKLSKEGESVILEFNDLFEHDKFFIDLLYYFNNYIPKEEPILMHYTNNWWPFLYGREEIEILSNLQSPFYTLCTPKSELDNWACDFENKIGLKVKMIDKKTAFWNFNLFGPYVINYIVDEKIIKLMNDYFKKHKNLKDLDLHKLHNILKVKGNFKIIFMINSEIRKNILKEIEVHFNKK